MGQITSMTGFGSGSAEGEDVLVRTVLRSVNGRFLDLSLRCPSGLQELEPRIRERVQGRLSRGKVTGTIDVEQADQSAGLPQLNVEVAAQYVSQLQRLAELGNTGPVSLEVLARMPGLFRSETPGPDPAGGLERNIPFQVPHGRQLRVPLRGLDALARIRSSLGCGAAN